MDSARSVNIILLFLACALSANAQDTLKLSRAESEAIFLKENLLLIAEKLDISQAEAKVLQAKRWPNPTIEIDEINLWATPGQLNVFGDELQGFNGGDFGRNQQLAFSIEQLIQTGGERRKLVALEEVSAAQSSQYFEDLLRNLKVAFRNGLTKLQYIQFSKSIYESQHKSLRRLTGAYQRQLEMGNVQQGEYVRLKAFELEMASIVHELNAEANEAQKELKVLMRLPASAYLEISDEGYLKDKQQWQQLALLDIIEQAKEHRPDYKIAQLEERYYDKLFAYERAQRVPDLTLKAGYDRGGNFMYNFVGFGIALDLPIFNRNQGNIKYAEIGRDRAKIMSQQQMLDLENEIVFSYQNLSHAVDFLEQIDPGFESQLDSLLSSYTKNFINRNISLLEYIDFVNAYLDNKKIILEAVQALNEKVEELNYAVGTDLIK